MAGKSIDTSHQNLNSRYDNEWGYSCRMVDIAKMLAAKMK